MSNNKLLTSPPNEGNRDALDTERQSNLCIKHSLLPLPLCLLLTQHGLDLVVPEEHREECNRLRCGEFAPDACSGA